MSSGKDNPRFPKRFYLLFAEDGGLLYNRPFDSLQDASEFADSYHSPVYVFRYLLAPVVKRADGSSHQNAAAAEKAQRLAGKRSGAANKGKSKPVKIRFQK